MNTDPFLPSIGQTHAALAVLASTYVTFDMATGGEPPAEMQAFAAISCDGLTPSTCAAVAAEALEMALDLGLPVDRKLIEWEVLRLRGLANALLADEQAGAR